MRLKSAFLGFHSKVPFVWNSLIGACAYMRGNTVDRQEGMIVQTRVFKFQVDYVKTEWEIDAQKTPVE